MSTAAIRADWQIEKTSRLYRPGDTPGQGGKRESGWFSGVRDAMPAGGGHLDLGCGAGRMTFELANRWGPGGWSIGADLDDEALRSSRAKAETEGLTGARFIRMDVEKEDYAAALSGRVPDLITAHLCMGAEIVERASSFLPAGGIFAGVALHTGLWKETGRASRFAMSEGDIENLLHRFGLSPTFLRSEIEIIEFEKPQDALEGFFRNGEAVPRWLDDGRWEAICKYFSEGGRTVTTHAQVQFIARKASA